MDIDGGLEDLETGAADDTVVADILGGDTADSAVLASSDGRWVNEDDETAHWSNSEQRWYNERTWETEDYWQLNWEEGD